MGEGVGEPRWLAVEGAEAELEAAGEGVPSAEALGSALAEGAPVAVAAAVGGALLEGLLEELPMPKGRVSGNQSTSPDSSMPVLADHRTAEVESVRERRIWEARPLKHSLLPDRGATPIMAGSVCPRGRESQLSA